jgi:hypothetical protein
MMTHLVAFKTWLMFNNLDREKLYKYRTLGISVDCAVCEVEAELILRVNALRILRPFAVHFERENVVASPMHLRRLFSPGNV